MKIKSLTIFCSSSDLLIKDYYKLASDVGYCLAKKKIDVIYGGGRAGLMGKVADSAFKNGAKVIGIIPKFLAHKENINFNISKTIVVNNMTERKKMLYEKGDAFLILPGGSGTIEEATEIISWSYLGIHNKQIIIFNFRKYWNSLFSLYENMANNKFGDKNLQSICKTVKTIEELSNLLK